MLKHVTIYHQTTSQLFVHSISLDPCSPRNISNFEILNILIHSFGDKGWVVQKLVNFNPGVSENSMSNFFFKKR